MPYITEIVTNLNSRAEVGLEKIVPNTLVEEMIRFGQETIIMKGYLLDRFDGGIVIYADDDVKSLIVSYLELEKIKDNNVYEHGEYLNSGIFSFTAKRDGVDVTMNIRYCPRLDIVNLVEEKKF